MEALSTLYGLWATLAEKEIAYASDTVLQREGGRAYMPEIKWRSGWAPAGGGERADAPAVRFWRLIEGKLLETTGVIEIAIMAMKNGVSPVEGEAEEEQQEENEEATWEEE